MSFPDSDSELRMLVGTMRELGVLQAFGVILGPEPDRLAKLEKAAQRPDAGPEVTQALAAERRQARIEAARQEKRDMLAGNGRTYTDAQIDQFIDPAVFD